MKRINRIVNASEEGYALVITMLLLFMLTVIGIAATNTSNIEVQISSNVKKIAEDFYDAEGGMFTAIENTNWLTDTFLTDGEAAANWSSTVDIDRGSDRDNLLSGNNNTADATVEIRCITDLLDVSSNPIVIAALSNAANNLPVDRHIGPPPVNSGYSLRYFNIRKYGVTSTTIGGATDIQTGVWKVFNQF